MELNQLIHERALAVKLQIGRSQRLRRAARLGVRRTRDGVADETARIGGESVVVDFGGASVLLGKVATGARP